MKRYIKYILASLTLAISLQSCDDYLEEINPNEVSLESFGHDLQETDKILTATYNGLLNQYIWAFDNESLRSDLAFPNQRTRQNGSNLAWHAQRFTNVVSTHYHKQWGGMYRVIFRANQTIRSLNGLSDDLKSQDAWTRQMAEARFLRGLMHFYLHSSYNNGEIIIRDEVPVSFEDHSKPVSTSQEVLDFFREDLAYAYDNLPAIQSEKARANKGLAALVLGKSYLYTEEYDAAIPLLKDVIEGAYGFSLLTGENVQLINTHAGDYSSESIFELNYTDVHQRLVNSNGDSWDEEAYTTRWARYSAPNNFGGGQGGSGYFNPTAWITHAYSSEPVNFNDSRNFKNGTELKSVPLRCAQMIAVANDEESTYYGQTPAYKNTSFGTAIFSFFKKFTNHDIVSHEEQVLSTPWQSNKNVVVYRLADAYLMLAECYIQKNDIDLALGYINTIRDRWGLMLLGADDGSGTYNDITYDQTSLMEHLMYTERPLELALEGYAERAIDLRRWGVAKQRFQDLAARDYQLVQYPFSYIDADGEEVTGNGRRIQIGVGDETDNLKVEFREAAVNYLESLHSYLPLPNEESLYNQNVN
ncbi:RagB/SusD family nutrient uptake outer membrane protein [Wenyingzhuangia sp. IMCC45574]